MVGKTISHYRVLRHLGAGGMGVVYEAEDLVLGRRVALKFLSAARSRTPHVLQRFEREARAASALNHPHICTVHEFVEHDGERFMVMELLDGESLRDRMARGTLDPPDVVAIGVQVADALAAAHAVGVTHRDLTPSNIFVTRRGDAKILDFGLAKQAHAEAPPLAPGATTATVDDTLTAPGAMMGTVAYMSPEQVRGEELDQRADLFAFGVVLYEAATGRRPFTGKTSALIFDAILHADPAPPSRLNPRFPELFDQIVVKALEKDPGLRYQSACEIHTDLQRIQRAAVTGTRLATAARAVSRRRIRVLAGISLVALAGAAAYWRIGLSGPPVTTAEQLTSGPGVESDPAISPDGSTIAYVSEESGNHDIWIVHVGGGPPQQLTKHRASDRRPVWLPDGGELLFVSDRGGQAGIWRAPRLDADAATLLLAHADQPALSRDGTQVAFVRAGPDGARRIAVAPLAAPEKVHVLTSASQGQWDHSRPAWSPDGKTICYAAWDGLWIVRSDGSSGARPLTTGAAGSDRDPTWTADGRFVYFTSSRDGSPRLWRIDADGGAPQRVTTGSGTERSPSLSSDGLLLAYATSSGTRDLRLIDLTTGAQHDFVGSSRDEVFPAFAPDARAVYFVSDQWGSFDIWKQPIAADGSAGAHSRLIGQDGVESHLACSPDGRWLAYYQLLGRGRNIWIAPTDGGSPVRITNGETAAMHPSWSQDGRRIAFVSERDGASQIWIQRISEGRADGNAWRLTADRSHHELPSWSPDDSHIAYITAGDGGSAEVAIVPARPGSAPSVITRGAAALRAKWHRAEGLLLVAGTWGGREYELRALHPDGRPAVLPHLPLVLGTDAPTFDVSQDARFVITTHREPAGDIWIMRRQTRSF